MVETCSPSSLEGGPGCQWVHARAQGTRVCAKQPFAALNSLVIINEILENYVYGVLIFKIKMVNGKRKEPRHLQFLILRRVWAIREGVLVFGKGLAGLKASEGASGACKGWSGSRETPPAAPGVLSGVSLHLGFWSGLEHAAGRPSLRDGGRGQQ